MNTLDRKLLRDLWRMKGQALAITLVIISGVATFVMLIGTMDSLTLTRDRFYRDYGFADVFLSLKRAPDSLRQRIEELRGVSRAETRVVAEVKLDIPGFGEPVTARALSLPDVGKPVLNRLYLRRGRLVEAWSENEVVVSEPFAEAHRFKPGDTFAAIINGRWRKLIIVGIALSPEFVIQGRPGALSPDYKRYGILWMGREALGRAYDMDGAFNDLSVTLSPEARPGDVIDQLDRLLDDYGGRGAYARKDQTSHRYLTEEFRQLERSAEIFPAIFIAVAAFLLNVVATRMVNLQRDQIATLKAFGYTNLHIATHYTKLILIIVVLGVVAGLVTGIELGKQLAGVYSEFYRFPSLSYELKPSVGLSAALITACMALLGTLLSVRRAAVQPPAEAMRPEPPARYRRSSVEVLGLGRVLSQPTRMILRNMGRRPLRSCLTVTGIASACGIMIAATFSKDAVDFMVDVQFRQAQKEDMTVTLVEPTSLKALFEIRDMRGVTDASGFRSVPARLSFGHRSYRTAIEGIERGNRLQVLLDRTMTPIELPPEGIVLTDYLANMLRVQPGDLLTIQVLEGDRPFRQIPVAGLARQYVGVLGYMDLDALNRLMREGPAVTGMYLATDSRYQPEIYRSLLEMPRVAGAVMRKNEIRNFYETQAEALLFFTLVATILAGTIAFGVVYNSARIALSERSRELASLRVLGYTRAEISYIFLGELAILTLASIPLGFVLWHGICAYLATALSSDLFRVPVRVETATYSLAATVVVVSACLSGFIVRHRLDHLDMVAVLKMRE
jgi:putative ABC transport system permease protein